LLVKGQSQRRAVSYKDILGPARAEAIGLPQQALETSP